MIPRTGALRLSQHLDHVGVFAATVDDVALLADCLFGADGEDPAVPALSVHRLRATAQAKPPVTPALAFVKGPCWDRAEPDMAAGFAELVETLGETIDEVDLPEPFDRVLELHHMVMASEMSRNLARYDGADAPISERLREQLEAGKQILAYDYQWQSALRHGLLEVFERYDAIVTPAAPGEAPADLGQTGDPAFCSLWTFCGVPAVSLPLLTGANGMPIGVQLVGRPNYDGRLLRTANWLTRTLAGSAED